MNAVLKAIQAAVSLAAGLLPEKFRPVAQLIAGLLGTLNLPAGDPKVERVAAIVAELMTDLEAATKLPDATAQDAARAVLENRAHRALVEIVGGGV